MRRVALLLAAAVTLPASVAHADGYLGGQSLEERWAFEAFVEYATPTASLRSSFVDEGSILGVRAAARCGLAPGFAVGIDAGFNRFSQDFVTGDHTRLDALGAHATAHYYLSSDLLGGPQPYVGVGVGGVRLAATLGNGAAQVRWAPALEPQLGILFTMSRGIALDVAFRYQLTTASFHVDGRPDWPVENPQWLGIAVGLALY